MTRAPLTFNSELAPKLLARFSGVEVERWDGPLLELPTRTAVRDYLIGKGVGRRVVESTVKAATVPLSVTKRGALAFARNV